MLVTFLAVMTALLYLVATGIQLMHLVQRRQQIDRKVITLGVIALLGHAIVAWNAVVVDGDISLGFYKVPALLFLVINIACIIVLLRRPLQNLLVVIFPLSALSILVSIFGPETSTAEGQLPKGVLIHVASSLLAYAVLTLAAFQAALVAVQDHQLKHRHTRGIIQVLPPLQLMETMLFELLWVGVVLLTVSIGSGMIFLDDIFAQHLVHKTVLTIIAWCLFSVLLWGHSQRGWRAQTAVRLTLAGFALLMLAYFGSKLVLELVLQRP
ncbi:MAG: cytochrome c biogenesis protein CcsA [Proteobacteria bacterium]|nr:cytochrome c biogenesis protein CcsA [Pseudomonadota bacterium]